MSAVMSDNKHWPKFHYDFMEAEELLREVIVMSEEREPHVAKQVAEALERTEAYHQKKLYEYWRGLYGNLPAWGDDNED